MAKARKVRNTGMPQKSTLSEKGHEIPDSTPFKPALKMRRGNSLRENIREILRSEAFARSMEDQGHETFEEADDFDVDDDFDPTSPYEEFFEGEYAALREARIEESKDSTKRKKAAAKAAKEKITEDRLQPTEPSPQAQRGSASKGATDGESPS